MRKLQAKAPTTPDYSFFRHSAVFLVGSVLVAGLNYLYHPIIGRLLTIEEFGQVQGYLAVVTQLGVVATVFGMILLHIRTAAADSSVAMREALAEVYSFGVWVAILLSFGVLFASFWLGPVLGLEAPMGWLLVAVSVFIGMPRVFARFYLQAEKRFVATSVAELLVAAGKIVCTLIFLYVGYRTLGAVAGFTAAVLIGFGYAYWHTRQVLSVRQLTWPRLTPVIRREVRYGALVLVGVSFVTFVYTADVLLVRYLFPDDVAGAYAGVATVARTIVFATAAIAAVLLSHVTYTKSTAENLATLRRGMLLTLAIGGGLAAVCATFATPLVTVLMGQQFAALAPLLPLLSVAMLLVALVNVLVLYAVALRLYQVIPIVLTGAASIAFYLITWHSAVADVVWSLIIGVGVVLALLTLVIVTRPAS